MKCSIEEERDRLRDEHSNQCETIANYQKRVRELEALVEMRATPINSAREEELLKEVCDLKAELHERPRHWVTGEKHQEVVDRLTRRVRVMEEMGASKLEECAELRIRNAQLLAQVHKLEKR